jgi:NitT/TauT family transport system substrate-binding protein
MHQIQGRRRFLKSASLLGLTLAAGTAGMPRLARAAGQLRVVSNPGLENATLNALMARQGYFERFGADVRLIEATGVAGPFDAIASGAADVCMVSGYNMVLPRIEQGAKVKIIGAGMKKVALTVYARPDRIATLADLPGSTVAVGPKLGLLHTLMLQLLKEKRIDASRVRFVNKGSNDECHEAVVNGEADACCSSISHRDDRDGVTAIRDANLWQALPQCVFQMAYASDSAIADKHDGLVATMAAYGALYDYLMSPAARDAFFNARRSAQRRFDEASAQAVWDFNRAQRPYSRNLSLSADEITYQQNMLIGLGELKTRQPIAAVSDMTAANAAAELLG